MSSGLPGERVPFHHNTAHHSTGGSLVAGRAGVICRPLIGFVLRIPLVKELAAAGAATVLHLEQGWGVYTTSLVSSHFPFRAIHRWLAEPHCEEASAWPGSAAAQRPPKDSLHLSSPLRPADCRPFGSFPNRASLLQDTSDPPRFIRQLGGVGGTATSFPSRHTVNSGCGT